MEPYQLAQQGLADLKAAIYMVLQEAPAPGLSNAAIGRTLGIYAGHIGHQGHISRTLLGIMAAEGVVNQDEQTKRWTIRDHETPAESEPDEA